MDRVLRHSWLRSSRPLWIALAVLIVLLGVGGYLITSRTISNDRDAAAERRARAESVGAQEVLGRARAYVQGLSNVLASEPRPGQERFATLAAGTAASVGLDDVLWVQRVPGSARQRYERRLGAPISRLTPSGRLDRAPAARLYLPATFTSGTRPELRSGVDVSSFPGLAAAIRDRATVFAVTASKAGSLGEEPGFYLLQAAGFGRGRGSRGFLAAFVPRGWFVTTLGEDPSRLAITQGGRRIEGQLDSADGTETFDTLGRRWRIDVAREPPSGLQSTLPWLALAWPFAIALIGLLIGRAVVLRRRAEREAQDLFERSTDLIGSLGFDGYFRRVNPAFVRTLGYSVEEELLSKPYIDLIHPDDVERSRDAFAGLVRGHELIGFETRFVCADGTTRLIQWNTRAEVDEQIMYGVGRDVTESRRAEREFEEIFNLSPDLLCIAGFDGYFKRVNPALQEAFGYSTEELLSRPVFDFGHPEDVPISRDVFMRLTRGETVPRFENRNIRADGSLLWLEWSSRAVVEEGIIYAAARDITERKRAEAELREAQETVEASRAELAVYAEDQAALRRVATLVAQGASPEVVLEAVAAEAGQLFGAYSTRLLRYEGEEAATTLAMHGPLKEPPLGAHITLEGESVAASVRRTGRPARMKEYEHAPGPLAALARESGVHSALGAPITVEGRLWGVMITLWTEREPPLAAGEERMAAFTQLVGTAIANAESRAELSVHVDQQAALRRIATLAVHDVPAEEIFSAVADELRRLFRVDIATVGRFEDDRSSVVLVGQAQAPDEPPIPTRWKVEAPLATAEVARTGRAARRDDHHVSDASGETAEAMRRMGVGSAVANPIIVEGRLWGVLVVASKTERLPQDAEERVSRFTDLVATAISNAKARDEVARLAEEQAALRRVATLAARGASPKDLFEAVAEEVGRLLPVGSATMGRFEPDGTVTNVASWSTTEAAAFPTGRRWPTEGTNVAWIVLQTGRTARIDDFSAATDPIGVAVREAGIKSAVGSPIVVKGHLWGVMSAASTEGPLPPDAEERVSRFTDLVATAIANAENRAELDASRARVVAATADERRRVVRDLHDGAQQRLVHAVITLKLALRDLDSGNGDAVPRVREALGHAERANFELRELVHGILPSALSRGGLSAAVEDLVSRSSLPVTAEVVGGRFPQAVEATAYFVVSEGLTNVAKHSRAHKAHVAAHVDNGTLLVEVRDDGVGGADARQGTGLTGLGDRVEALGGTIWISSPPGRGTSLLARIPAV